MPEPVSDIRGPSTSAPSSRHNASLARDVGELAKETRGLHDRFRRYADYGRERDRRIRAKIIQSEKLIKQPSRIRYGIVLSGAILLDILMVIVAFIELSGAAIIITIAVQIVIITPFWMLYTRIFLGRTAKDMSEHRKRLETDVESAQKTLKIMRARYARIARQASRSPAIRQASTAIAARTARLTGRSARLGQSLGRLGRFLRGPVARIGGNIVPWIKVVPWYVLGVIFTYREHQREYELSVELMESWKESARTFMEGEDGLFTGQMELASESVREQEFFVRPPIESQRYHRDDLTPRPNHTPQPSSIRDISPAPTTQLAPTT